MNTGEDKTGERLQVVAKFQSISNTNRSELVFALKMAHVCSRNGQSADMVRVVA